MSWPNEFHNFSAFHWATVAVCFAFIGATVFVARRATRSAIDLDDDESGSAPTRSVSERGIRLALAWFALAWMAWTSVWWLLPAHYDPYESWPLHMCDICLVIGPLALLTQWRWATTLIVHWGIGLTTQAFATPHLEGGIAHVTYWMFFVGHTLILLAAVYPIVVLGYRPRLRDLWTLALGGVAFLLLVLPIDIAFNVNYGYVGDMAPPSPTLIDVLGPWPLRVLWLVLLGNGISLVVWAALWKLPRNEAAQASTGSRRLAS